MLGAADAAAAGAALDVVAAGEGVVAAATLGGGALRGAVGLGNSSRNDKTARPMPSPPRMLTTIQAWRRGGAAPCEAFATLGREGRAIPRLTRRDWRSRRGD